MLLFYGLISRHLINSQANLKGIMIQWVGNIVNSYENHLKLGCRVRRVWVHIENKNMRPPEATRLMWDQSVPIDGMILRFRMQVRTLSSVHTLLLTNFNLEGRSCFESCHAYQFVGWPWLNEREIFWTMPRSKSSKSIINLR